MADGPTPETLAETGESQDTSTVEPAPAVLDPLVVAQAEAAKDAANQLFKEKHYTAAIAGYSKAIDLNPSNAVYYSNRAFCNLKLENYGAAVADATKSIELDPKYVKGYYRRGDSNFAMGKFKLALKDLRTAAKVAPNDPDLRKKLAECEKEVKRQRFEEALAHPPPKPSRGHRWTIAVVIAALLVAWFLAGRLSPVQIAFWLGAGWYLWRQESNVSVVSTIDLTTMLVEDSYTGPRMEGSNEDGYEVTLPFVKAMMQEFKDQKLIHKRFAFEIVLQAYRFLATQPTLVDISIPEDESFTVCGDVHGQYYDLLNIFEMNGLPSLSTPYLFNGDFVDRGSFSVEIMLTLFAFKILYPDHFYLARGNHESKAMNKIYGFEGEVKAKYNGTLADVFRETFCLLPLAHVLNNKVIVVHGGLFSSDDVTLDDIRKIDRNREPPDEGVFCELLWSDPGPFPGRQPSKRGVGVSFGPDVTKRFLEKNGLELVVRSHEVKEEGYEVEHDGRLITVFSAPNYCDQMGNKGAFVRFNGSDMVPHFTQFAAVPHPDVKPMAYANSFLWGM